MRETRLLLIIGLVLSIYTNLFAGDKKIVYLVSDIRIPFWKIISEGIEEKADALGYELSVYSANNQKKTELQNLFKAIETKPDGIVISPINSSTAQTILKFANKANIPVVIADIGTQGGKYLSYISSDNYQGAYEIAQVLVDKLKEKKWDKDASIGIISIPQKRANGKARTAGFVNKLNQNGIEDITLYQQVNFSYKETYEYTRKLIKKKKNLRAIWLQGSDRYQAALDAIDEAGKKDQILLLCFDAEPEFIQLIQEEKIIGSAMQQPYLIGEYAIDLLKDHFQNKEVAKKIQLKILAISSKNINEKLQSIKKYSLGLKK